MVDKPICPTASRGKFLQKLQQREIDVQACFQCGRCSAGCPVAEYFDLSVMAVVRLAAYGEEERLLHSRTIWLCAACETCASRCPNGIEIAGLMDILRELACRKGITAAEPRVAAFHQAFLASVGRWGRVYEMGMIASYKLHSGDLTGDLPLGLRMVARGRLRMLPEPIAERSAVAEIFAGKGREYER